MELLMPVVITTFVLFSILLVSGYPKISNAQNLATSGLEKMIYDKKLGGVGNFKRLSFGSSNTKCGEYAKKRGWKRGRNTRGGRSFFVALADTKITQRPGNPGFIDGRYIAFRESMIKAKGQMVKHLEATISSEAISRISRNPNMFSKKESADNSKPSAGKVEANNVLGIFDKSLRLLNLKLDSSLKKEGFDPKAKKLLERKKAVSAAKKIIQSSSFSEILESVAKNKLKGVFAKYVFENIPSNETGSICVMAYYSTNTEKLANAMASRDFSATPTVKRRLTSIDAQIPSDQTDGGVRDLISSFGISIHFDEKGQVNIVSYGQAEISNINNDLDYEIAKGRAELIAQASIRRFINETVSLSEKSATAQNIEDLRDNMRSVKLDIGYFKKLEEVSSAFPINGMYTLREWGAQHPLTGQGIAGSVVVWNAQLAEGAIAEKRRLNLIPQDVTQEKKSRMQRIDRNLSGTGQTYQGGKKESEDF